MLISLVEERIEELYQGQQLDRKLRDQIEDILRDELSSYGEEQRSRTAV